MRGLNILIDNVSLGNNIPIIKPDSSQTFGSEVTHTTPLHVPMVIYFEQNGHILSFAVVYYSSLYSLGTV